MRRMIAFNLPHRGKNWHSRAAASGGEYSVTDECVTLTDERTNIQCYLIISVTLESRVYSASNRNKHQKQKNNVSGEE
jgi:hypothetical protein